MKGDAFCALHWKLKRIDLERRAEGENNGGKKGQRKPEMQTQGSVN